MSNRIVCCSACVLLMIVPCTGRAAPRQVGGTIQAPEAPRDRVPPPRTGTAAIKGRVVDGISGVALARARVMVLGVTRVSAITDAAGGFAFANLPAGSLMLSVDKPTYLQGRYPAAGKTIRSGGRPVMLADGQTLDNVTIPLFHGAAIMGRVLDANGDPLDNAQVSVLRVGAGGRSGRPIARGGASSDDRGEYRVGRLDAGTYIIQVNARRGLNPDDMMPPGMAPPAPAPQPLPTYYPGALAIEQAQAITLERGQTLADIDIVLAEGYPGIVTGTVTTGNGTSVAGMNGSINVRRVNNEAMGGIDGYSSGTGLRPDGTFRLTLPPGDYQLEARVTPRTSGPMRQEDEQFAISRITVTSGTEESIAMTVGRGATATGRVVFEGNTPAPPSPGKMHVPLYSDTGTCRSGEATIAADWSFHLEGLSGTCTAPPMVMFGRWTLKSVIVNGEDIADAPVTFEPGQQFRSVQVVVTDRRSELSFHVTDDKGDPTREYVIVAFPIEKTQWRAARIFVGPPPQSMVPPGGRPPATARVPGATAMMAPRREAMPGLHAGQYFVIAVDDLEPDDYRDPGVLDRLRSSATRVTLAEGATVDVPLRRVSFADLMASR
jgi:hypothetical protein